MCWVMDLISSTKPNQNKPKNCDLICGSEFLAMSKSVSANSQSLPSLLLVLPPQECSEVLLGRTDNGQVDRRKAVHIY
jgi:hypothetical protein